MNRRPTGLIWLYRTLHALSAGQHDNAWTEPLPQVFEELERAGLPKDSVDEFIVALSSTAEKSVAELPEWRVAIEDQVTVIRPTRVQDQYELVFSDSPAARRFFRHLEQAVIDGRARVRLEGDTLSLRRDSMSSDIVLAAAKHNVSVSTAHGRSGKSEEFIAAGAPGELVLLFSRVGGKIAVKRLK